MDVVVKHKVVGVYRSWCRGVIGADVNIASGERKETPILDSHWPSRRGCNNNLGYWELVLEDEIVLGAEECFGYGAVNDATGIGGQRGILLD